MGVQSAVGLGLPSTLSESYWSILGMSALQSLSALLNGPLAGNWSALVGPFVGEKTKGEELYHCTL